MVNLANEYPRVVIFNPASDRPPQATYYLVNDSVELMRLFRSIFSDRDKARHFYDTHDMSKDQRNLYNEARSGRDDAAAFVFLNTRIRYDKEDFLVRKFESYK